MINQKVNELSDKIVNIQNATLNKLESRAVTFDIATEKPRERILVSTREIVESIDEIVSAFVNTLKGRPIKVIESIAEDDEMVPEKLSKLTRAKLYKMATDYGVPYRSRMNKDQLVHALSTYKL